MGNMLELEASGLFRHAPGELSEHLTPRQLDVLALLCEGLSNKLIGRRLNISSATVKIHVANILRVLQVSSRLQAVVAARRRGLVDRALVAEPVREESSSAQRALVVLRLLVGEEAAAQLLETGSEQLLAAGLH